MYVFKINKNLNGISNVHITIIERNSYWNSSGVSRALFPTQKKL